MSRVVCSFLLIVAATPALADLKFTKLSDRQFVVHHRKMSVFGAEAKATNTAYREAAALCIAAGFTHLEVQDLNVGERVHASTWGGGRGASADVRVKFYANPEAAAVDEKDLVECQPLADPGKVEIAKRKLAESP